MTQVSTRMVRSSVGAAVGIFVVLAGTLLGLPTAAGAEVASLTGSAFSYSADVSLFGGPPQVRGHGQDAAAPETAASPAVECPDGGGAVRATAPDGARAEYGPAVFFGGIWPEDGLQAPPSGPLTSEIDCVPGEGGQVSASTSASLMPPGAAWATPGGRHETHPGGVGPGPFVAEEVHSSCTATPGGVSTDVMIVGGILETEYEGRDQRASVVEQIPERPEPNTTREGALDHLGDRYRITFNEQIEHADGTVTVNAARIVLLGPNAAGEIVVGSSTCGATASAAAPSPTALPPAAPQPSAAAAGPPADAEAASGETTTPAAAESPTAASARDAGSADSPTEAATMRASQAQPDADGDMVGRAYNYFVDVGLFGGPANRRGFGQPADAPAEAASPAVECPAGGGTDSATEAAGASARYGPATIFGGIWPEGSPSAPPSGPLTSEVDCQPGERVSASTSVTLPRGVGPGPLVADEVHSSCVATAEGITTEVRIVGGTLETQYDQASQQPTATEPIPENPQPNYTREGTLDHVGDSYRITFNQQVENADGSVTVNAAHMELLGPTAVGDMVLGSSTCGLATATTGTPRATDGEPPGGQTSGGERERTTTRGTTGTTRDGQLARTGSDPLPMAALGLGLMLLGTLALQWGRIGRPAERASR